MQYKRDNKGKWARQNLNMRGPQEYKKNSNRYPNKNVKVEKLLSYNIKIVEDFK